MISQAHITADTPMGATLVNGGATFRVWATRALAVYLHGTFGDVPQLEQTSDQLMVKDTNGYWTRFVAGAREGDPYTFYVVGSGSHGVKRDPYARELAVDAPFPNCSCLIRNPRAYPWHDQTFRTPDFSNMVVYQLHIGSYAPRAPGVPSTFLDVIGKIEYLQALGINVLQPLPIDECETAFSMGYNGGDYFSPDFAYVVYDRTALSSYLVTVNRLRWRQPALRGPRVRVIHVHNHNRVLAFHRWLEGRGRDVLVIASLNDTTMYNYDVGFPSAGHWVEVFNSDVYDNWVNPTVEGNGGGVEATGAPLHGFEASCAIVLPAKAVIVFARDQGD